MLKEFNYQIKFLFKYDKHFESIKFSTIYFKYKFFIGKMFLKIFLHCKINFQLNFKIEFIDNFKKITQVNFFNN